MTKKVNEKATSDTHQRPVTTTYLGEVRWEKIEPIEMLISSSLAFLQQRQPVVRGIV